MDGRSTILRSAVPERDWITHELRDQTAHLIRFEFTTMRGGLPPPVAAPIPRTHLGRR